MCTGVSVFMPGVWAPEHSGEPSMSFSFRHWHKRSSAPMAEFLAIRDALLVCKMLNDKSLTKGLSFIVLNDCQYAVGAFNGKYTVIQPHLIEIDTEWSVLLADLCWSVEALWVTGKMNSHADKASRQLRNSVYEFT